MTNMPGKVVVGLDVGGTKIAGGIVDPATGQVRHAVTLPTDLSRGSDAVRRTTVALASRLVLAARADGVEVIGIGVGVPELVAPDGTITSAHLLPWDRDVLAEDLRAGTRTSLPVEAVRIESDVRCAALAEARFGAGRSHALFVYLSVGTGIAFCLVQDGVPYAGARGHAHLLLAPGSEVDDTADVGGRAQPALLEAVAAGPALVARYRSAGGKVGDDAREVLAAANAGESVALAVVREAGALLGEGLAVLVNALDPCAVVVGGGLGLAGGPYRDCAVERARRRIWAPQSRTLPIVDAGLGLDAGVVGAALAAAPDSGRGHRVGGTLGP